MQCRLYVTPTDLNQIPNGELAAVKGSPFDFTHPHSIGERIGAVRSHHPQLSKLNTIAAFHPPICYSSMGMTYIAPSKLSGIC